MPLADQLNSWRHDLLRDVQEMIATALGRYRAPIRVVDVPFVLGSRGVALAAGDHAFLRLGLNGTATILTWSLAATVAGASSARSCTLDVLVGTTLATAASICGGSGNRPQLVSQAELVDRPPTNWTVEIADPRWLLVKVASADGTVEEVGFTLRLVVDAAR